jgi:Eukaryotic aspartyl protease
MYVLGNIFLNNYYVVYDLENYRVGLVPSKNSSVGETQVVQDVALIIQDFVQGQNIIYLVLYFIIGLFILLILWKLFESKKV